MNANIFNVHDLVLIITSAGAFLLGLGLFLFPKRDRLSTKLLAGFFFCESIRNTLHLFFWHSLLRPFSIEHSSFLALIYITISLTKGPILYFYVLSILDNALTLSKRRAKHLLAAPMVAGILVLCGFGVEQIASLSVVDPFSYSFSAALYFVPWCYALLCYREISRMNAVLKGFYSSSLESGSGSFQLLVYGYIIVWTWQLFTQLFTQPLVHHISQFRDSDLPNIFGLASNYLEFCLLFALYAYSVSKDYNRLAHAVDNETLVNAPSTEVNLAEHTSEISPPPSIIEYAPYEFARSSWPCADKIKEAMENRKIFLDHSVNLERFSARIGERPKDVSYALNTVFKTTFFEFINNHRVREAKRLLLLDQLLSINDVIEKSGFSSKSAFHRVFKSATEKTPGQFRNEHREVTEPVGE